MNRYEERSLEAIKRRIKVLDLIKDNPMSVKMINASIGVSLDSTIEDVKRLVLWGCIEKMDGNRFCTVSERAVNFYRQTKNASYGYEFLKETLKKPNVKKALQEYKDNFEIIKPMNLDNGNVYIPVPGNPNATIVMNSNRPLSFYRYQKTKNGVNRGIGSTFSLYDGA
jgi:hypothetical protein